MGKLILRVPIFLATGFFATIGGAATPPFAGADAFIQKNCAACHDSSSPAARLDLTKLIYQPANPDDFATWVKVHDRVSAGEMPPAPIPRPPSGSLTQFVNGLSAALTPYEHRVTAERGRAGLRRLNAYECENALRDLLNVPWVQIKSKLPQHGEAWRYNKIGAALDVSYVQLARYMSSADYAMREAMAARLIEPTTTTIRIYAPQEPTLLQIVAPPHSPAPADEGEGHADVLHAPFHRPQRDRLRHGYGADTSARHLFEAGFFRYRLLLGIDRDTRSPRSL